MLQQLDLFRRTVWVTAAHVKERKLPLHEGWSVYSENGARLSLPATTVRSTFLVRLKFDTHFAQRCKKFRGAQPVHTPRRDSVIGPANFMQALLPI
jgi:hypothetical protein